MCEEGRRVAEQGWRGEGPQVAGGRVLCFLCFGPHRTVMLITYTDVWLFLDRGGKGM